MILNYKNFRFIANNFKKINSLFINQIKMENQKLKLSYPLEFAPRGNTIDKYPRVDGSTAEVLDAYRFLEDPDS